MMAFIIAYKTSFDLFLISLGLAYSQQIVLRGGVFSVATTGFAAISAYASAILTIRHGVPAPVSVVIGTLLGAIAGALLSVPLARLRGVFQAIATLAFVEIVSAFAFYADGLTGGAAGINNIPHVVETWHLLLLIAAVVYLMSAIGKTGIGRAFDVLRQDETVAAALGVSVVRYHALAFVMSGALGGLFGALLAFYSYGIDPSLFGFNMVVAVLTAIVLGGRTTVSGPIVGAAIMAILPELARPLAEYRPLVNGILLMLMISFMPYGVADTVLLRIRQGRMARRDRALFAEGSSHAATSA